MPDDKDESWSFAVVCDPQLGFGGLEHDILALTKTVDAINRRSVDRVFFCGDLVSEPTEALLHTFKSIADKLTVPYDCAPGNHDVAAGSDTVNPRSDILARYRRVIGKDYVSVEHKGCLFIVVNSQFWVGYLKGESEQHDIWFRQRLEHASTHGLFVIIVAHFPLYQEMAHEANGYWTTPNPKRGDILALLEPYNVKAFLSGHCHRLIENDFQGTMLVTGESTCKPCNTDCPDLGFRVWRCASREGHLTHSFVPITGEA